MTDALVVETHKETFSKNGFIVEKKDDTGEGECNIFQIKTLPHFIKEKKQLNVDDFYDLLGRCAKHIDVQDRMDSDYMHKNALRP